MGRRLGQHFLKGTRFARALVEAAGITENDTVLEIGPGKGALTKEILATGAHVIAIEKDEALVDVLQKEFEKEISSGFLRVISEDIRNFSPEAYGLTDRSYILAANIPYYITGEIIRSFLTASAQPKTMALLIQKEVAQRIVAKRESLLSLSVKAYGFPRIAAKVPRGNFSPPPAVDSAILVIERISRDFFHSIEEKRFFALLHSGFASKRKKLAGNLVHAAYEKARVTDAFNHCAIPENARAEDVPLESWKCLLRELH